MRKFNKNQLEKRNALASENIRKRCVTKSQALRRNISQHKTSQLRIQEYKRMSAGFDEILKMFNR